jgi:hypothetical protein
MRKKSVDKSRHPCQNDHLRRGSGPESRREIQNESPVPQYSSEDQSRKKSAMLPRKHQLTSLKMLEQDQPVRDGIWTTAEIELINEKALSSSPSPNSLS